MEKIQYKKNIYENTLKPPVSYIDWTIRYMGGQQSYFGPFVEIDISLQFNKI